MDAKSFKPLLAGVKLDSTAMQTVREAKNDRGDRTTKRRAEASGTTTRGGCRAWTVVYKSPETVKKIHMDVSRQEKRKAKSGRRTSGAASQRVSQRRLLRRRSVQRVGRQLSIHFQALVDTLRDSLERRRVPIRRAGGTAKAYSPQSRYSQRRHTRSAASSPRC